MISVSDQLRGAFTCSFRLLAAIFAALFLLCAAVEVTLLSLIRWVKTKD